MSSKKIAVARFDKLIALPTAEIGWSKINKPSEEYNKYSLDYDVDDLTPKSIANIDKALASLVGKIKEELGGAAIGTEITTMADFIAESGKTPTDSYGVDDFGTYLRISLGHKEGVSKKGTAYTIRPKVYDKNKQLIAPEDVPALLPGSEVRPIVQVQLYSPAPATKKDKRSILTSVKLHSVILVNPRKMGGGALDDSFFDGIDGDTDDGEAFDEEDF